MGSCQNFDKKIQSSGKKLGKTRAATTAATGSNIFTTMNVDQNFDGACVGNLASKIYRKLDFNFLLQNIDYLFYRLFGP